MGLKLLMEHIIDIVFLEDNLAASLHIKKWAWFPFLGTDSSETLADLTAGWRRCWRGTVATVKN